MGRVSANGVELEYQEWGSPADPVLLLICGFSVQMTSWPEALIEGLVKLSRRVIAFDNRDIGLSTELKGRSPAPMGDIVRAHLSGAPTRTLAPYLLEDMADDAVGLLDALGVQSADVFGTSMGGMIAQLMALRHPNRVSRLMPVMTTSRAPDLPPADPDAQAALTEAPVERTAETISEAAVRTRRAIGSIDGVRDADDDVRQRAIKSFERSDRPNGVIRQYAAILAQPFWHERLSEITAPTLVLHGAVDPLIKPACGEDVARRIPGAVIEIFDGWGHDLPAAMVDPLVRRIGAFL